MGPLALALAGAAALGGAYAFRLIGDKVRVGDDALVSYQALLGAGATIPLVPPTAFAVVLHVTQVTPDRVYGTVSGWADGNGSILSLPVPTAANPLVNVPRTALLAGFKVKGGAVAPA